MQVKQITERQLISPLAINNSVLNTEDEFSTTVSFVTH
jgi:hypothetical protein